MRREVLRALGGCAVFLLAFVLTVIRPAFAEADSAEISSEEASAVLRVAFPEVAGFSMTDEYGERYGLVVDYLNEIAKYTGWQYEYVDANSEDMLDKFLLGEYDLLGGAYYTASLKDYIAYPEHNIGHSKSVLLARWEDTSIRGYDILDLDGKTIGVFSRAEENIRRLKEFLSINGIECTIKEYNYDQQVDNSLYYYLETGEVDLLLGNSAEDTGRFHKVAVFDSQPIYIVTTPDKKEILEELNWAMKEITESNPRFSAECYSANFQDSETTNVYLNDNEMTYVQEKGVISVAIPSDYHPFICLNREEHPHSGLVPEVLDKITEFTGLKYELLYVDTYENSLEMVERGEADMAGFFMGDNKTASEAGLAMTRAYTSLNDMIVRNKLVSYPSDGLSCAILKGRQLPAGIVAEEVQYYDDVYGMLDAVNKGKADFAYGLSAKMEMEMQRYYLPNVIPVSMTENSKGVGFVLSKPADSRLLSILNKAITNLTSGEQSAILNRNLISMGSGSLTLKDYIYANPFGFLAFVMIILLLIVATVMMMAVSRVRAAVMRTELAKAEADSRAKSAFLSRMSHEIRTPMNAIVGLTDLTSMLEGVPEHVQVNLTKLRSSARYLLCLLNDILDMSRIDSGMMTIAAEPFSLEGMLDELHSMMTAEAARRGLELEVETEIRHPYLNGDVIRLRQVLTNLLSNALKFTPTGGHVTLRVLEKSSDENGAVFSFSVADDGVGIPKEDQTRIFDAFEQTGGNQSKSQGTGLGLPISRSIVRLMGGELNLTSEPGRGSEFYFTIAVPYGQADEKPETPASDTLLAKARILLVEDNELNAEIATELLMLQGASVELAQDGRQGVELFLAGEPGTYDIILMDIQMPVMNGLEATRAIRALERPDAASVPIIAMTANSFQEDIDAAKAAGMDGFITKPLDVNYLYRVLGSHLAGKKTDAD